MRVIDLQRSGVVDRVVDERPDAADEPEAFAARMASAIAEDLVALRDSDPAGRRVHRRMRLACTGCG